MTDPQPDSPPTIYILRGDDSLAIQRFIDKLMDHMGDDHSIADLNISRLEGRIASEEDIRTAVNSMPFLLDRRLVILSNPLTRLSSPTAQNRFIGLLENIPPSSALVLVIEDVPIRRKGELQWEVMKNGHWLEKWSRSAGKKAFLRDFLLPGLNEMPTWIQTQAKKEGGQFTPAAALSLTNQVGNATQQALQEIVKLLTYVNFSRPVEPDDVEALVAPGGQVNIFDLVDSLATGASSKAMRSLNLLLVDQDPQSLFGMIVRQYRLLIQAREILDEGGNSARIASELHQAPFVADKLANQAARFKMFELENIYHHLLEIDEAAKTSQMAWDLAFQIFVTEQAR